MKKIYFSLMAMALAVCFTACQPQQQQKEDVTPPAVFDVTKIVGSWDVTFYSYVMTNTDAGTAIEQVIRQNPGEITIEKDEEQYRFTETFTDPDRYEVSGEVVLHDNTFDLRGGQVDYPDLVDLSVKTDGGKTTWESSYTGRVEKHDPATGTIDEKASYNYKTEIKIAVTKK